jgi:hypothetical protein
MEGSFPSPEVPPAVRALVERAQEEFEVLIARRDELSWHINKIGNAIRALESVVALELLSGLDHNGKLTDGLTREQADENDNDNGLANFSAKNDTPAETPVSDFQLKRACRIALMESEAPASSQELYNRILRRDSCDLRDYENPAAILDATLTELALAGEAQLIRRGNCSYWQRIVLPRRAILAESCRQPRKNPLMQSVARDSPGL